MSFFLKRKCLEWNVCVEVNKCLGKKWLIGTVCLFRVWQCSSCQHCILFDTVCWLRVWQCSLCQYCILFDTVCWLRVWQCSLCQHCILFDTVCWLRVWQCSLCQHCIFVCFVIYCYRIVLYIYHIYMDYNIYSVFNKSTLTFEMVFFRIVNW